MNTTPTPLDALKKLAAQAPAPPHNGHSPESIPSPTPRTLRSSEDARARAYALAVLRNHEDKVRTAPDGHKHDQLLKSARTCAGFIPYISESEIEERLYNAVKDRAEDPRNAEQTIQAGIRNGSAAPLPIPIDSQNVHRYSPESVSTYGEVENLWTPGTPENTSPLPGIIRLADVQPEELHDVWAGHFWLGKLSMIEGDPGLGKGLISADLAARITTDRPMPDGTPSGLDGPAGVVLLTTAEDGLADTIRPRLDAVGADSERVAALVSVQDQGLDRLPTIADLNDIRRAIAAVRAKVVIIDPLMAYLPGDVNSYRDQDIRRLLAPLAQLADEEKVAIPLIRHLTKGQGGNPLYRGGGSIGIIGACRSGFLVAPDPEDSTQKRRIFAPTKNNLSAMAPALAFHIEGAANGSARIVWEGPTNHTAAALLALQDAGEERSTREDAMQFLKELLGGGPQPAENVLRQAGKIGISNSTLQRAKKALGIKSGREGFGPGGDWMWELPDNDGS